MAKAKTGDTVRVHYTGKVDDQEVFDSSAGRDPLEFTLGTGQVIPGFEQAVEGMEVGEERSVTIPPEQAYGERRDNMTATVPRDQFPPGVEPEVGQQLQMNADGQAIPVRVTEISADEVTLDANHPLAGQELTFELALVEIV